MRIYLKGYYGYQNLGDELLLLGLLQRLEKEYSPTYIYIESQDPERLNARIHSCKKFVKTEIDSIVCVSSSERKEHDYDLVVFGGGEVVSDARPRPYNGRNYLLGRMRHIAFARYILVGGIGTPRKLFTGLLYRIFLGNAERIVVRDPVSYTVAEKYTSHVEQYHDFAHDILIDITPSVSSSSPYMLVNVNRYMRNKDIQETLRVAYRAHSNHTWYIMPAAWGSDDSLTHEIRKIIPDVQEIDWRLLSLEEIVSRIVHAEQLRGTRLHVLLIRHYFGGSYVPFVYQEKIEKCLLQQK